MSRLQITRAPNLPIAPVEYEARQVEMTNNALRLYFNELDNMTQNVLGNHGLRFLNAIYGVFSSSATQTVSAADTPTAATFNTTGISDGVQLSTPASRIQVLYSGIYKFTIEPQLFNTTAGAHSVYFWLRVTGTDVAASGSKVTINTPSTDTATSWNYVLELQANDYVEVMFASDDATMALTATAAQTVPYARPAIPSIIMTVTFVSGTAT